MTSFSPDRSLDFHSVSQWEMYCMRGNPFFMFLILSFCFYCFNKWCRHRRKFIYWVNGTTKLKFGKLVVKMNLRVGLSDAHRFSFSSDHSWSSEALAADTDALSDDLHLWEYMTVKHRGGWSSTCNCLMSCVYIYISCNCLLFCFFIFSLQRLTLLHVNSNQCLDMPSEDDKMVPTLRDCNGSRSQQWLLRNMTLSVWLFTSVLCRSPPNQSWLSLPSPDGSYHTSCTSCFYILAKKCRELGSSGFSSIWSYYSSTQVWG